MQIQEKMALRILEDEEQRMYNDMYAAERLKKEQRWDVRHSGLPLLSVFG